jgi:hypothetical protein
MFALPPKVDINEYAADVRFVPKPDQVRATKRFNGKRLLKPGPSKQ